MNSKLRIPIMLSMIAALGTADIANAQDGGLGAGQQAVITVTPNQFGNVINIQMAGTVGRNITFELRNNMGNLVLSQSIPFAPTMQVNTSGIEAGQYTARVIGGRGKVLIEKAMERMADE